MERVLDGILVLDFARYIAGPWCSTIMAEMGAEVIRIETPGGAEDRQQGPFAPNGQNFRFLMMSRNKRGITLDLSKPRGKELFRELVKKADVVVENFSPPVKKKLGFSYEDLSEINPNIILTTVSAFGKDGPYAHRLGFDHIAQAESGSMSFTGFPDSPHTRSQVAYVDMSTALHAALATVLAILHRTKTGKGQQVEMALLDTAVSYAAFPGTMAEYEILDQVRPKLGNTGYYSFSDTFYAKDGMVIMAALSDPLWNRMVDLIGHPEFKDDPRFADDEARYRNRDIVGPLVQEWIGQRSREDVFEQMGKARIPCGRVNTIPEAFKDQHIHARQLFTKLDVPGVGPVSHPRVAIRMSKTPGRIERPAPTVGQHNDEVYSSLLGLSAREIEGLSSEGVI